MKRNEKNQRPLGVWVVEEGKSEEDKFWLRVGSAFAHQDGRGFNIQLNGVVPLNGRLVVREPKADQETGQ